MLRLFFSSLILFFTFYTPLSFASTLFNIPPSQKKSLTAEVGGSVFIFNNMHPTQRIGLLGYRTEWDHIYTEVFAGGFGPSRDTYLAGADIGASFWHFSLSTGAAWLTHTSAALCTHWQLVQSLRFSIPQTPLFIAFRHFSNGHKVFQHRLTPNHGENFFIVGVQYDF